MICGTVYDGFGLYWLYWEQSVFIKDLKISKRFECVGTLKIHGKNIHSTVVVKYLAVKIESLDSQHHINDISFKLNRTNASLFKIRKNINIKNLRSIFFPYFWLTTEPLYSCMGTE